MRIGGRGRVMALIAVAVAAAWMGPVAPTSAAEPPPAIEYRAHVQRYSWTNKASAPFAVGSGAVSNGWVSTAGSASWAGSTGLSLRVEAFQFRLPAGVSGGIECRAHVQKLGWLPKDSGGRWVDATKAPTSSENACGTTGQSKRVEAVQLRLTGDLAQRYDLYYRAHVQTFGWLGWAKNGDPIGSAGGARRVEAIEVRLVPRGGEAPGNAALTPFVSGAVTYRGNIQRVGVTAPVRNGASLGTVQGSARLEALWVDVPGTKGVGSIECRAYVQNRGWLTWVSAGSQCGTKGQSLRVEALQVRLTGKLAKAYDVYYRVSSKGLGGLDGWLGWARNGGSAGSSGGSRQVTGLEMRLVGKGITGPGTPQDQWGYRAPAFFDLGARNSTLRAELASVRSQIPRAQADCDALRAAATDAIFTCGRGGGTGGSISKYPALMDAGTRLAELTDRANWLTYSLSTAPQQGICPVDTRPVAVLSFTNGSANVAKECRDHGNINADGTETCYTTGGWNQCWAFRGGKPVRTR